MQLHGLIFTQRIWKLRSTQKPVHGCLWQPYLKLPKLGSYQHTLQQFVSGWTVIQPIGYHSALRQNEQSRQDTEVPQTHVAKSKKPMWEGCKLYGSNLEDSQKGRTRETIKSSVVTRVQGKGVNKYSRDKFQDSETILFRTMMRNTNQDA